MPVKKSGHYKKYSDLEDCSEVILKLGFAMLTQRGLGEHGFHVIFATTQSAREAKSRICRTA